MDWHKSFWTLLLLSLAGCGGNTVADGASTTTGATTTSTTCASPSCSQLPSSCNCAAECGGKTLLVSCLFSSAAYVCTCSVDGAVVGSCNTGEKLSCDLQTGCCAQFFQ